MIALICIDVDGTLVGRDGTVRPEIWPAVDAVRAHGVRLALCSGRPAFGRAREYAERLAPEGWHVFQNGASVVHLPDGASRSQALPAAAVAALSDRARATGRAVEFYTDTGYGIERDDERARRHAALLGIPFAQRPPAALEGRIVRAQWLLPHADAEAVLAEPHAGLTLTPSYSPIMRDTTFISVTAAGVDKASAVRAVAEAYAIPLDRVMMVGDGANDASAMRAVGFPVAMGNAEPEARAAARYEVGHVEAGGLGEALALALRLRAA